MKRMFYLSGLAAGLTLATGGSVLAYGSSAVAFDELGPLSGEVVAEVVLPAGPADPGAAFFIAHSGGGGDDNSGHGGGGGDDNSGHGGGDDGDDDNDNDDDDDDDDDDESGSGRDRPRIPGGSGCDDPGDVAEHAECRG